LEQVGKMLIFLPKKMNARYEPPNSVGGHLIV
jgi:hypothetical protein